MLRNTLPFTFIVAGVAFAQTPARYGKIEVRESADAVMIDDGAIRISASKRDGLASYAWNGSVRVRGAYSSVQLGRLVKSSEYNNHVFSARDITPLADGFGKGIRVSILNSAPGRPALRQNYYVYEDKPYFFIEAVVESGAPISTNWLAPIVVDTPAGVDIGSGADGHVLFVPWDNDHFIRFRSDPINGAGTSYEATAIYDNTSRQGLVLGSVTHDTWKTGIDYSGSNHKLDSLKVYGGASSKVTQDNMPHGRVSGAAVHSPRIFVGYYDDWRTGMEDFGAANSVIAPPLPWKRAMPLGWNSWAAYGCRINPKIITGVSDFIKSSLQTQGFENDGAVYVNWDSACSNPLAFGEEYAEVARHIKANGHHPGIYFSSFGVWQWAKDGNAPVMGTEGKYTWNDILLRDANNNFITIDGGRVIDATHPGTKMYVEYVLNSFKRWGYEFVKLDFLSHGAVEGKHYIRDMTAMQAYNYGMKYIRETAGDSMFISLSIAPLFPGAEYAHARRISCDAFGKAKDTEYMLNSVTYGWWLGKYYRYNDGDHIVVGPNSPNEAQSRVTASVIAGLFLDSDKLADDATAQARAKELLTRPEILALARKGRTFRPVEGNSESRATEVFVLGDGDAYYLAVFNYQPEIATKIINLARAGLNGTAEYHVTDLWSGAAGSVQGSVSVPLEGLGATILRLTR